MLSRTIAKVIGFWVFVSLACSSLPGPQTPRVEVGDLSAQATSPVAVRLEWQSIDAAIGYQIEARYGDGEFFPVAEIAAGQTSYDHFVVPGSTRLTYRLNAITGAGQDEIASASVAMPELAPSPLLVQPMASAPTVSGLPDLTAMPTIDPLNPDPNVMATLAAAFEDAPTDLEPPTQPVWVRKDIGPEGGIVTLAGPNQLVFTLEVPAGAVEELTTIYLTPIGEIGDFPFAGGSLGAVQIHPPIAYHSPLTLTIALPADQAASSAPVTVGFAVSSFNSELSLAPIYAVGENAYKMNVYWGDTFGLAAATLEEVKAQAGRIPSDSGEQLAQQLAALRAFHTDTSPEGEARIAAQILQGILQLTQALTAGTSPNGGAVLAAPAPGAGRSPDFQYGDGAKLFASIQASQRAWDYQNQTIPPGARENPDPGNQIARSMAQAQARIVEDITQAIQGFLDEHQGCRTKQDLFAQALLQILISPESDFQRQVADNYRSRFGAPESKVECTYQLHIVQSTIEGEVPAPGGILTLSLTVSAHANPISLEMVVRGGRPSLRGVGPVTYDQYEIFDSSCPPPVEVTPYPSVFIWITDLMPIFDTEGRVSNFALQGVIPDPSSSGNAGELTVRDEQPGRCTMIRYVPPGGLPDLWGWWFAAVHNPYINTDNWSIVGDDSYVATSTVTNWTQSFYTESTTMVLTVNQMGQ